MKEKRRRAKRAMGATSRELDRSGTCGAACSCGPTQAGVAAKTSGNSPSVCPGIDQCLGRDQRVVWH